MSIRKALIAMLSEQEYRDDKYLVDLTDDIPSLHVAPYDAKNFNDNMLFLIDHEGFHTYAPPSCIEEARARAGTAIHATCRFFGVAVPDWKVGTWIGIKRTILLGPLGLAALRASLGLTPTTTTVVEEGTTP